MHLSRARRSCPKKTASPPLCISGRCKFTDEGAGLDARGYLPYEQDLYIIPKLSDNRREYDDHTFPVPPKHLWLNYGVTADEYLSLGETHVNKMVSIANSSGFSFREGNRVLDFGCAAGRMIRWLDKVAAQCEIWVG